MIWSCEGEFICRSTTQLEIANVTKYLGYDLYIENDIIFLHKSLILVLDTFVSDFLQVPDVAHFDIVVDFTRSGKYDLLSYNDYRIGNGYILPSNISKSIVTMNDLGNQYLVPESVSNYFEEIKKSIATLNHHLVNKIKHGEEWFKAILDLQTISTKTPLILHSSLQEESIEIPDEIKIDVIADDVDPTCVSINPYIDTLGVGKISIDLDSSINKAQLNINRQVRNHTNNIRVVLNKELKDDLTKLKEKSTFSISPNVDEREFLTDPSSFLGVSSIDFSTLSDRVIEIGQYNPQYYSFLIPGNRGKWIPNIQLENSVTGHRTNIQVKTKTEFKELKDKIETGKTNGESKIVWNGEELPITVAETLVPKFEKAFQKAQSIPETSMSKEKSQTLVLVIHENAIDLEYSESSEHDIALSPNDIEFKLFQVNNLKEKIQLRDHQRKGVATIQYLMNNHLDYKGVLLADDMGLGKTIQVLFLIEYYAQTMKSDLPCLIVAPVSLLKNWEEEYTKFFNDRSYQIKVVRGSDIPKGDHEIPEVLEELRKPNLILTNYETFRDAQLTFGQINFGLMAIDEAQRIKTPGTMITSAIKAAKAEFKIAMTGTPVENTMVDLWSIIDFIQPGLFQSAKEFHGTYQKPMENTTVDHKALVTNLRDRIGLQFIRRLKVDVAQELPEKIPHLIECPLTAIQVQYYTRVSNDFHALDSNNPLAFIHKLKLLCDCPLLLDYNLADLSVEQLTNATARLKALQKILQEVYDNQEKVILFTEYRKTQDMLQKVVREWFSGYNPKIINGTTATEDTRTQLSRQSLIDDFQANVGFGVIIMSPVAAGVGLNVTAANHVVHYSRHWNPAKESQATDRAYRIGQTKDVHVYYLLSTHSEFDTFDVILASLLKRKEHLSDTSMYPSTTIQVSESELVSAIPFKEITGHDFIKEYTHSDIVKLEPLQFEAAIGAIYLKSGQYDSVHLTPRTGDRGADLVCFGNDENLLIQVKQSKNKINDDGLKDLEIAQLTYPKRYKKDFKSVLISNSTLTRGALQVLKDSKTDFQSVSKLMSNYDITSISYDLIVKVKNSIIPSFI